MPAIHAGGQGNWQSIVTFRPIGRGKLPGRLPRAFQSRLYLEGRITIEEADESQHWLEMLAEAGIVSPDKRKPLMQEAIEIVAILTASAKTARENLNRRTQDS